MSVFLMATSFRHHPAHPPPKPSPKVAPPTAAPWPSSPTIILGPEHFGTLYDISTILILAFAGASAMAGLLNLIPRYLPRFGMAPEWARASRPLVLVFMSIAAVVTLLFHADVDAQGGAYATGVLVLMTSGSCAVTMAARRGLPKILLGFVSLVFIYTTVMNVKERPEGIKIAAFFIFSIIFFSLYSRVTRSTELRITDVQLDDTAKELLREDDDQVIRLIAWNPQKVGTKVREDVAHRVRVLHGLSEDECIYFLEIAQSDASEFTEKLSLCGHREDNHRILSGTSPVVANAVAALLLSIKQHTGHNPHVYFQWTDVSPIVNIMRFLFPRSGRHRPPHPGSPPPRHQKQKRTPRRPRRIALTR